MSDKNANKAAGALKRAGAIMGAGVASAAGVGGALPTQAKAPLPVPPGIHREVAPPRQPADVIKGIKGLSNNVTDVLGGVAEQSKASRALKEASPHHGKVSGQTSSPLKGNSSGTSKGSSATSGQSSGSSKGGQSR